MPCSKGSGGCDCLCIFRILAQSQVDRFPADWNAWKMDEEMDDTGSPKDDSGHPKPRSLSTPNIPVHILSTPLDCPKITSSQTSLRKFIHSLLRHGHLIKLSFVVQNVYERTVKG